MSKFVNYEPRIDMAYKKILAVLLAIPLACSSLQAATDSGHEKYLKALELYDNGMYEEARTIFESLPSDALTDGYAVLCAVKLRTADYESLMGAYERNYRSSILSSEIRFENARILFDKGQYGEAALVFSKVDRASLSDEHEAELVFKHAYCCYELGMYGDAFSIFSEMDGLPENEYSAPSEYFRGVILYTRENFPEARRMFSLTVDDPRFRSLSEFYIVDCEFNMHNYRFALEEGERIYPDAPEERRERLARIVSESALVLGDADKARKYYDGFSKQDMNRNDLFYAGSVMYSVKDYQGAIDNFVRMTDRSDSLGQIANYHLGNAYIHTGNQVAAMESFRQAAAVRFDPQITEDALFNYAKLAFDLNKDTKGFAEYIDRYSTSRRGVQIYGYMALAALYDKDYAGAVAAYDSIDELTPDMRNNYTKANFLRGEQLFEGGSYTDAIPYYRATAYYLPKTDRLNQLARYRLAQANFLTGKYDAATREYTDLYNNSALYGLPQGNILPYNIGYCWFKQGRYSDASRWFDIYLESGNPLYREDALTRRADCDFGNRDYKAAVASYQQVLNEFYSPDRIYPYYQQALSYGLSGDKRRKVSVLAHVKEASPDSPMYDEACYELGRAQMDMGDGKGAEATFSALKTTTGDKTYVARATIGLGMVYRNSSEYDRALECYKEVVSMMPGSEYAEESMLAIESIYQRLGQPGKFLEYMEQNALNTSTTDAEREKMYFNTAEQLYLAGNYSEAASTLTKFLDNYPASADAPQAWFYLAESYRETGDKEKAVAAYSKAMVSETDLPFAEMSKLRYAQLSFELQRYQDAYEGYSSLYAASRMESNRREAEVGMMNSAYRCKDYVNAVKAAEMVEADPDTDTELMEEARYIRAKSLLASSHRDEAMALFSQLGANPSTSRGAEAKYLLIQNLFDTGDFDSVEKEVYDFSQTSGNQSYWLAKAYLVLGDSFYERGLKDQARATYESIRDGYVPSGSGDDIAEGVARRLARFTDPTNE